MYLRIIDETINYPYTIKELREAYPNVSLPAELSEETLSEWDVYSVSVAQRPNDYTKNISEGTPILIDGKYYQNWIVANATESEINYKLENQWEEIRLIRNQLLSESDWTQLGDVSQTIKDVWTTYRQQLRDVTNQQNPFNIEWPVKP
jgi:hypothetical protein